MSRHYTPDTEQVIRGAEEEAKDHRHNRVGPEHLLLSLVRDSEGVPVKALQRLGVTPEDMADRVRNLIPDGHPETGDELTFPQSTIQILENALQVAWKMGWSHVKPEHILIAVIEERGQVVMASLPEVSLDQIRAAVKEEHRFVSAA